MIKVGKLYHNNDWFWVFFQTRESAEQYKELFVRFSGGSYPRPEPTEQWVRNSASAFKNIFDCEISYVEAGSVVMCLGVVRSQGLYKILTGSGEVGWIIVPPDLVNSFILVKQPRKSL
jgi:hypothetical protein